jgi:ELWxxDGT repeat protein
MERVRIVLAVAALAAGGFGQQWVASGVGEVLGATDRSVWFEAGGRVQVVGRDGLARDTGVAVAAGGGQRGDELFVYAGDRVHAIDADGSVTTRWTPAPIDGGNLGVGWEVWRRFRSGPREEIIELFRWDGAGWTARLSGVSDPLGMPQIEAVEVLSDRYLVLASEGGTTGTRELFEGRWFPGTGSGECWQTWRWSGGVMTCAEEGSVPSDAFVWFVEAGGHGLTATPASWGWGGYRFALREPTAGCPWVESGRVPEFIPFLLGEAAYPLPGETTWQLFWLGGGGAFVPIAEATTAGVRRIVSWTAGAWAPVPALAGCDGLSLVGELGGRALLGARDPTEGFEVVAFDVALGGVEVLVSGLAAAPGRGMAFAGGLLFAADDGSHGRELWFSRGDASQTWMVADLEAGAGSSAPRQLAAFGEHAAFVADVGGVPQLFVLDATELDWRRSPVDGRWYRLTEAGSWPEVERAARRLGGLLATVRGAAEQDWLWTTFGPRDLWIGLEDRDGDDVFTWLSGEPLAFTAWCPGEPSPAPPGETAVHMAAYPGFCDGGWNDQDPGDRYPGIAERDGRPVAVEEFGSGCAAGWWTCGSYGPSTLRLAAGWPRLGGAIALAFDARQDPAVAASGFLALGFDSAAWAGLSLPRDLAPLGFAPGCALQVAVEDLAPVALDGHGRGAWAAEIPTDPALAGGLLFAQGLALVGRSACSEASNGVRVTLR